MKPLISINLCCYNSEKYLRETLESVAGQTYENWELVIVNDGSTDSTESIIFEFRDKGHPVTYHYQQNRGLQFSRNKAIELSRGDYLAFFDHDDILMPDMLERQLAAFDEETILVYGNFITKEMTSGKEYMPFDPDREFHYGRVAEELCKKNFIWLETVLARTEAVHRLGEAFDPHLRIADDIDFLLRLSLTGNFKFTRNVTFLYRMHPENLTTSRRHYFVHDYSYMLQKYRDIISRRMLRDLARQYLLTVRLDLNQAGFRVFPFLRLGFNVKHILISFILPLFGERNILEIKADLMKPVNYLRSIFSRSNKPME